MEAILKLLKKNKEGLTITELVKKSKYSRSTIRTGLAYLDGARKIKFRNVGMAKVYNIKSNRRNY